MADEHDKNNEEEYQFPEDEYVQAQSEPTSQYGDTPNSGASSGAERAANILNKVQELAKNRIVAVVVVVIVLLIGLRLFGGHSKPKVQDATASATTPVAAVSQPVVSQPNPEVQNQLSSVSQQSQTNQTAISQLQSQVQQLQNSIDSTTENKSQLTEAVAGLAQEVSKIQKHLAPAHKKKVVKVKPVVFYLRAVVPGRAWIYGTNGRSATIALGDSVRQYGKVLGISATQGKVLTSSGKVIQFSSNDR
jgi:intracellular multiplication protein IcmG